MTSVICGLEPIQVRDLVVRPILEFLALPGSEINGVAERLIMGTAAQESQFRYIHQLGSGPALGLWQMEPATFRDLWQRYFGKCGLSRFVAPWPDDIVQQLATNLILGCAMCRVHYYSRPFTMPDEASIDDLARIWKMYYNTIKGAGHPSEFVTNYRSMILPLYGV